MLLTSGLEDRFLEVLPNLKERVDCLKAIVSGAEAFETYKCELDKVVEAQGKAAKKAEKEAAKAAADQKSTPSKSHASPSKFQGTPEKKKDDQPKVPKNPSARHYPLHKSMWDTLRSLENLQIDLDDLGVAAPSAVALQREMEEWKTDGLEPLKNLCAGVKRLGTQVRSSKHAIDAELLKFATQRQKARDKVREAREQAAGSSATPSIFNLEFDDIIAMPELESDSTKKPMDRPWIIPVCDPAVGLCNSGEIRLNTMVFKAAFNKETKKRKEIKALTAETSARSTLLQVAAGKIDKDSDMAKYLKLSGEDLDALTKVHIFGYKGTGPICGPDIHCLGSLRCTCEKSAMRVVLSVALSSAQVAVAKRMGKDDQAITTGLLPSIAEVVHFIKTMLQEALKDFSSEVEIYHTVAQQGSLLYTPPGFILFEQLLNTGNVVGVVVSCAPWSPIASANLASFKELPVVRVAVMFYT